MSLSVSTFLDYRHGDTLDCLLLFVPFLHLDAILPGVVIRPVLKHGPRSLTYVRVFEL